MSACTHTHTQTLFLTFFKSSNALATSMVKTESQDQVSLIFPKYFPPKGRI